MKDGNLLIASDNFEDGTVEDFIIEMDRQTGEIVKTIDLKKILLIWNDYFHCQIEINLHLVIFWQHVVHIDIQS